MATIIVLGLCMETLHTLCSSWSLVDCGYIVCLLVTGAASSPYKDAPSVCAPQHLTGTWYCFGNASWACLWHFHPFTTRAQLWAENREPGVCSGVGWDKIWTTRCSADGYGPAGGEQQPVSTGGALRPILPLFEGHGNSQSWQWYCTRKYICYAHYFWIVLLCCASKS